MKIFNVEWIVDFEVDREVSFEIEGFNIKRKLIHDKVGFYDQMVI